MSHYLTVVLVPNDGEPVEHIDRLLEPYSEQREVEPWEDECYCIGNVAERESWNQLEREQPELGRVAMQLLRFKGDTVRHLQWVLNPENGSRAESVEQLKANRDRMDLLKAMDLSLDSERPEVDAAAERAHDEWRAFWDRRRPAHEALVAAHPEQGKPRADCDECNGTGHYTTTHNQRGYWDYWLIGGRWHGVFQQERISEEEYDQDARDRDAVAQAATGRSIGQRLAESMGSPDLAPNIDTLMGRTGYGTVDPDQALERIQARHDQDAVPAGAYLSLLDSKRGVGRDSEDRFGIPFALVTPDGEWHAQGRMGWFGCSSDELSDDDWLERVRSLVSANLDTLAVACDLHT